MEVADGETALRLNKLADGLALELGSPVKADDAEWDSSATELDIETDDVEVVDEVVDDTAESEDTEETTAAAAATGDVCAAEEADERLGLCEVDVTLPSKSILSTSDPSTAISAWGNSLREPISSNPTHILHPLLSAAP